MGSREDKKKRTLKHHRKGRKPKPFIFQGRFWIGARKPVKRGVICGGDRGQERVWSTFKAWGREMLGQMRKGNPSNNCTKGKGKTPIKVYPQSCGPKRENRKGLGQKRKKV